MNYIITLSPDKMKQVQISKLFFTETIPGEYATDTNTVLLLHLNEEEGFTFYDASGRNNNAYSNGAYSDNGVFGYGKYFDGTSYATVNHTPDFDLADAFTAEAWIKVPGNSVGYAILDNGGSGYRNYALYIHSVSGNTFTLSGFTNVQGSEIYLTPSFPLEFEQWYHVALTADGQVLKCTLMECSSEKCLLLLVWCKRFTAWYWLSSCAAGFIFNGTIDEIRISNIARLPSEFNALR